MNWGVKAVSTVRSRAGQPTRSRNSNGFTLIELMIIMVILGILAAIVIFAVQSLESSSAVSSCKADFKTVETAQETYRAQTGTSATSFTDLLSTKTGMTGQLVGPWLKEAPTSTHGYVIGFDLTPPLNSVNYGNVTVQSTNPAHGPDVGNADCSYA